MSAQTAVPQQPQPQQQIVASATTAIAPALVENKQFVVTPDYIQQSMLIYHQPSVIVYNPNCAYPLQNDYITHTYHHINHQ